MEVLINRTLDTPQGTTGQLYIDEQFFCYTIEPDAAEPDKFYIPDGLYTGRRHHGVRWPNTFEIVRPGTDGVDGHTALLFHSGNTIADSEGCILLGSSVGKLMGDRAVLNSGDTFKRFLDATQSVDQFDLILSHSF
jgi:Family of unknown function (DUF5675)